MPNLPTNLFVYGTLKRGLCRSWALNGQRFLGTAQTEPHYRMFNVGEYPGLVACAEGNSIRGELWEVDAACLAVLDEVEGVAQGQYRRELIKLLPPHQHLPVQAYFYERPTTGMPDCGCVWDA